MPSRKTNRLRRQQKLRAATIAGSLTSSRTLLSSSAPLSATSRTPRLPATARSLIVPSAPPKSPRDLSAILSYGAGTSAPFTHAWTDFRTEQVKAYKHWVYIAISTIAKAVASRVPNISYVYSKEGLPGEDLPRALTLSARRKALTPLQTHEEIVPADPEHPLCRLLANPNEPDTAYDFWYETVLFLLLTGSAYWYLPKNRLGLPCAAWVVPSHWVWPVFGKDRLIEAWELRPVEGNYLRRIFDYEEIIPFRLKNPVSKIDGHSPMTAGAPWIDVADHLNKAKLFTYRNGSFPTVAVQFDGKLQDPSDEDLRRIESKFITRYVGETRTNKPLFLPPGVKVAPLNIKPNEMVMGETAAEMRDNILSLFGVPKLIAGQLEGMTYGSIAAAHSGFCTFTINPLLRFLGQGITEKLAYRYDTALRAWWEDATPQDPDLLEAQLQTDMMCGAITSNEVRVLRGREPYPDWGNDPVFPVNMTTLPFGGKHQPLPAPVATPQPSVSDETSFLSPISRMIFGTQNSNGHHL